MHGQFNAQMTLHTDTHTHFLIIILSYHLQETQKI